MASIASLAIQLVVGTDKVKPGLVRAQAMLSNFAQKAAKMANLSNILTGTGDLLNKIPIIGGALGAIPAALGGLVGLVRETTQELVALGHAANRTGLDVGTFQAALKMAGPHKEAMAAGLMNLARTFGQLQGGSLMAARSFERMGISVEEIRGKDMDDVFRTVLDKIAAIPDKGQQATAAFNAFGAAGMEILPRLQGGANGLDKAMEQLRGMGLLLSPQDIARAQAAEGAMRSLDKSFKAIKQNLAIELAPILGTISKMLSDWISKAGGLRGVFHQMAEWLTKVFVSVAEVLDGIVDKIRELTADMSKQGIAQKVLGMQNAATETATFGVFGNSGGLLGALAGGGGGGGAASSLAKKFKDTLGGIMNAAPETKGTEAMAAASEHQREVAERVAQLTERLQTEAVTWGRVGEAVERYRLMLNGASPAQLAMIDGLIKQKQNLVDLEQKQNGLTNIYQNFAYKQAMLARAMEQGKISVDQYNAALTKMNREFSVTQFNKAAEIFNSTRTPLENMRNDLNQLDELLRQGRISWSTYGRAAGKSMMPLLDQLDNMATSQHAGALEFNSREAYSAVLKAQDRQALGSPEQRLQKALDLQAQIEKEQLRVQNQMADAIRRGKVIVPG